MSSGSLYEDDPLPNLGADQLDRDRLAGRLVGAIATLRGYDTSVVCALVGPWGCGKTTLLKAVEAKLELNEGWAVVWYNPWAHSSLETATEGFFAEISSALPDTAMGRSARATMGKFARRVAPIGVFAGLIGIDGKEALESLSKAIAGDQSPEALRRRMAENLHALAVPILVIIDDLDRLEPAELLLTFRLVRMLGRLPYVYYLLAFDEATLESILMKTDLISEQPRAADYLEKMIQIRLDIPPIPSPTRFRLLSDALKAISQRHSTELQENDYERLSDTWEACIALYLQQPRGIKRLAMQVELFWPQVAGEVDFIDFVAMTFLRIFDRASYSFVLRNAGALLGQTIDSRGRDIKNSLKDLPATLKAEGAKYPDAVNDLLLLLFPSAVTTASKWTGVDPFIWAAVQVRRGVGSTEFFSRYVQLGVTGDDISDLQVDAAAVEFCAGEPGPAVAKLNELMRLDPALVIAKLRRSNDRAPFAARPALEFLAGHYLPGTQEMIGISSHSETRLLARKLISMIALEQLPDELRHICGVSDRSFEMVRESLTRRRPFAAGDSPPDWLRTSAAVVATELQRKVLNLTRRPLRSDDLFLPNWLWSHLRFCAILEDNEMHDTLLRNLVADDSSWKLVEIVALAIMALKDFAGPDEFEVQAELMADKLFGLALLRSLAQERAIGFIDDSRWTSEAETRDVVQVAARLIRPPDQ